MDGLGAKMQTCTRCIELVRTFSDTKTSWECLQDMWEHLVKSHHRLLANVRHLGRVFFSSCSFSWSFSRVSPCPLQDPQSEQSRLEASTYAKCVKTPLTLTTLLEDALLDALLQLMVPLPKFRTNAIFVHATQLKKECVHVHGMLDGMHPQIFFDPKVLHSWHVLLRLSASHSAPSRKSEANSLISLSSCQSINGGKWISMLSSMAESHPKLCWNADLFSRTNMSHDVTCLSKSKVKHGQSMLKYLMLQNAGNVLKCCKKVSLRCKASKSNIVKTVSTAPRQMLWLHHVCKAPPSDVHMVIWNYMCDSCSLGSSRHLRHIESTNDSPRAFGSALTHAWQQRGATWCNAVTSTLLMNLERMVELDMPESEDLRHRTESFTDHQTSPKIWSCGARNIFDLQWSATSCTDLRTVELLWSRSRSTCWPSARPCHTWLHDVWHDNANWGPHLPFFAHTLGMVNQLSRAEKKVLEHLKLSRLREMTVFKHPAVDLSEAFYASAWNAWNVEND